MKDVEKLLKLDPSNTELVRQKQQLLAQAIKDTKEKLATLKTAAEQANEHFCSGAGVFCRRSLYRAEPP